MSDTKKRFAALFQKARKRLEYFVHGAVISFTESVVARMEDLDVSKSDLAEKLNCKPSYITKALGGGTNFTIETMVKIALALDSELELKLVPGGASQAFEGFGNYSQMKPEARQARFDWNTPRVNMICLPNPQKEPEFDERLIAIAA